MGAGGLGFWLRFMMMTIAVFFCFGGNRNIFIQRNRETNKKQTNFQEKPIWCGIF